MYALHDCSRSENESHSSDIYTYYVTLRTQRLRLCLTRKLNSCQAQAYRMHARTFQPRRRGTREGAACGSVFTNPSRLPFGLRYTANLHAVMTSCRKTANNKSERPSYERSCTCWYAGAVTRSIRDRGASSGRIL